MKTQMKTYKGTVIERSIAYLGKSDVRIITFTFKTGKVKLIIKADAYPPSISAFDIITFNCTYHAGNYFASNVVKVGSASPVAVAKKEKFDIRNFK